MALLNYSSFSSEKDFTLVDLTCLRKFSNGVISRELTCLITMNIVLSITAILGNTLILIALHKDSSLHSPSKLLFRTLATTDLCVGLICTSSKRDHLDFGIRRAVGYLSIYKHCAFLDIIYLVFGVLAYNYCNKCGPTSFSSVNAQIQTNCNSKANACGCCWLLGCVHCLHCLVISERFLEHLQQYHHSPLFTHLSFLLLQHFPFAASQQD